MGGASLFELLEKGDPGYYPLNWLSLQAKGGIYVINLLAGLILSVGVVPFFVSSHAHCLRWPFAFRT